MNKLFSRAIIVVLLLVITACSMGAPVPTATPLPTNTPVLPTATDTPVPTLTPTPVPMASVSEPVDCYAGPSEQYDKVTSLETGAEIQIVGQSDDGMFWIVVTGDGSECWLAKENAALTMGEVSVLPLVIPPATPTLGPPAPPSDLSVTTRCDLRLGRFLEPSFIITWQDNSFNEEGYIIYKDGLEVKRLKADTTKYSDGVPSYVLNGRTNYHGPEMIYAVASFNAVGISTLAEISVRLVCPK